MAIKALLGVARGPGGQYARRRMSNPINVPFLEGDRLPVDRFLGPIHRFVRLEASSGIVMLVCAAAAMAWANSPWQHLYESIFHGTKLTAAMGGLSILSKHPEFIYWINDAFMAAFFFLVGLEIKREVLVGELSSVRKAAVPVLAALGGMVVPAGIYVAFNAGHETVHGWGVPMATDIAFALGVMALLGRRVPAALRVFLAALAIADDIGALVVIALFYTGHLELSFLWGALACVLVMAGMNIAGVKRAMPYAIVGLVLWYMVLESGVHATIAGVIGAMTIPVRARVDTARFAEFTRERLDEFRQAGQPGRSILTNPRQQALAQAIDDACDKVQTPLHMLEHVMAPWVAFLVIPVFALANAGVALPADLSGLATSRVTLGVALGLMLGKPIGITLFSWFAVKTGIGALPHAVTWRHIHGAAWLGGIGFTMSLFIATLAYDTREHLDLAKLGILGGSIVAAVVGLLILRSCPVPRDDHAGTGR